MCSIYEPESRNERGILDLVKTIQLYVKSRIKSFTTWLCANVHMCVQNP